MNYNIIEELSTSSTRNAHVLTLFESSRKMVLKIAEKVDTWMKRSAVDIQAFEGQGYDYGLRMLTAFARVVRQCFQAHESTMSEDVRDQKKQAESLREWNRIALHRCRCEACLHLKQINKHHLASLPLWLCEEYASEKHQIDSLPHFVRDRQHSLAQLFSNDADKPGGSERANKTIELYQAPLFCFWPQCRDYEIEKIEVPHRTEEVPLTEVKQFLLGRRKSPDDPYEFIVSIHCNGDDVGTSSFISAQTKAKAAAQAKKFDVIIMRPSKEAKDRHRDLRWIKVKKPVSDTKKSYVNYKVEMPIPKIELEDFTYLCYLNKGIESTRFNVSARVGIILASAPETPIVILDVDFKTVLDSSSSGSGPVRFVFNHTDGLGHRQSNDKKTSSNLNENEEYVAVAFAEADQVWQTNKLLLLLDLIKQNRVLREQKSSFFHLPWFRHQEKCPTIPSKYAYLVNKFLQFLHPEAINVSESFDTTEWKLGCIECLRDQSVAFMSELPKHVGAKENEKIYQKKLHLDNTAIASGPLAHAVEQELALIADVKSIGDKTEYQFSESSIRKGLDHGRTVEEITKLLTKTFETPWLQPLQRLIAVTSVSQELALIADVKSTDGETEYQFSESSIRKGLHHGRTVEEITKLLTKTFETPWLQPLLHFIAVAKFNFDRDRYEACQDTIAHFMGKIKVVYTTTGVLQAASTTANYAAAAVVAAHDGAGIGQAADSKSTVKVETNSVEKKTKQSVKRILDPNIEVAILQR